MKLPSTRIPLIFFSVDYISRSLSRNLERLPHRKSVIITLIVLFIYSRSKEVSCKIIGQRLFSSRNLSMDYVTNSVVYCDYNWCETIRLGRRIRRLFVVVSVFIRPPVFLFINTKVLTCTNSRFSTKRFPFRSKITYMVDVFRLSSLSSFTSTLKDSVSFRQRLGAF